LLRDTLNRGKVSGSGNETKPREPRAREEKSSAPKGEKNKTSIKKEPSIFDTIKGAQKQQKQCLKEPVHKETKTKSKELQAISFCANGEAATKGSKSFATTKQVCVDLTTKGAGLSYKSGSSVQNGTPSLSAGIQLGWSIGTGTVSNTASSAVSVCGAVFVGDAKGIAVSYSPFSGDFSVGQQFGAKTPSFGVRDECSVTVRTELFNFFDDSSTGADDHFEESLPNSQLYLP
jgi:hypothetical protein